MWQLEKIPKYVKISHSQKYIKYSMKLNPITVPIQDGEGNSINVDYAYSCRAKFMGTVEAIREQHLQNICIVPISGASGGGGIFQQPKPVDTVSIGLKIEPPIQPVLLYDKPDSLTLLELNEIYIDKFQWKIYAGAGVTLDQLNKCIAEELGQHYRVLGADLTSYTYAQVGATFMTGGMGPQRRYFSDSVVAISLFDGRELVEIADGLESYAATYGWSGIITAVCCRFVELPENEIAFALPVNNTSTDLARLLAHFAPLSYLQINQHRVSNKCNEQRLIFGIEHVTKQSMQPMFSQDIENEITRRARSLVEKCDAAGVDGLVFINGFSDKLLDDFLLTLVDDVNAEELCIAGTSLEHTELFTDAELMRAVREAVPFAARTQAPVGEFIYKGHTDSNIRLNPECVEHAMGLLWDANIHYVESVKSYFSRYHADVRGQILVYGHLNPYGVDPHNRLTLACDTLQSFNRVCKDLHEIRDEYVRTLQQICQSTGSIFVGGEKGACSESEIFEGFKGVENAPLALQQKFKQQVKTIRDASAIFNWRALHPYK